MMFLIRLLLYLIQVSLVPTANAASPPLALIAITNQTTANDHRISVPKIDNGVSLFYTSPGDPIPREELRHTLSSANSDVRAHLPRDADRPMQSSFETKITFSDTRDNVHLWVYAYHGISWRQLNEVLTQLQAYMLGVEPGPYACRELEFYVSLVPGIEVARGAVEFTRGKKAVAKRVQDTTTLQLVQANYSSQPNVDLPIIFNIAKGLDLKVTEIGLPIPESAVLEAIDAAFTTIVLDHEDIDAKVPKNLYPYKFNQTSGIRPEFFTTEIIYNPTSAKRGVTWSLLCLFYYGLRDFMRATKYFNNLEYKLVDARLGDVGSGEVQYYPSGRTASKIALTAT